MRRYVLDACALIALLKNEKGEDKVANIINDADAGNAKIIIHKMNLLEVFYEVYREKGQDRANSTISEIKKHPIEINSEVTDEIFTHAGRLKATYKISLADSIVLAQAMAFDGELLTADHHEFDVIEGKENVKFAWIR